MRLILFRHGETEHNRSQLTLGRADVPLTQRGLAQARAAAASLTGPLDAVYSSPLARARDMAAMIAETRDLNVHIDDGLVEMDVGELEHLTGAELRERHPDFLRLWLGLSDDVANARMPGGETLAEVQERGWAAIERMRAADPNGTVVAVSHNFVILTTVCRALGLPLARFRRIRQSLAARTVLEVGDGTAILLQLNDTAHLAAAGIADDQLGGSRRP